MHPKHDIGASSQPVHLQKSAIRLAMRAARSALGEEARAQASAAICERLAALPLLQNCASVAVYLATRNEANIDALARALMKRECVVAAPVLSDEPVFARLRDLENIVATGSGLRVPVVNTSADYVAVRELDVVLLPALAFNRSGARLGQGGGWYDRVLAEAPHVVAVGVCFDYQVLDALPIESHDMRVSIIVTETQIIKTD